MVSITENGTQANIKYESSVKLDTFSMLAR